VRLGRRNQEDDTPDTVLPFLTRAAADRLRREFAAAFAEQGLEVTVYPDRVVDGAERSFGLYNLAAACGQDERGEKAWPRLVREHVSAILAGVDGPDELEQLSTEQVRKQVYPRLYDRAGMPPGMRPGYAVDFTDGIVEVLNLDLPETVALLTDRHVDLHGGRAALRTAGLRNLLTVLPELQVQELEAIGGHFTLASGSSVFTATTALVMPELLARLGIAEVPHGVLVCMPHRAQIAVHPLVDATAIPSLKAMIGFALGGFNEGAGPLSPHVYWWHLGSFEQVTSPDTEGAVSARISPGFQAALEAVTRHGHDG
jgi:hypothetical protein